MTVKDPNLFESDAPVPDPRLDSLLDQALAPQAIPGGIPDGLARRILTRTAPLLKTRHGGVLAMMGPQMRVLALAACVALAVSAGMWAHFQSGSRLAPPLAAGPVDRPMTDHAAVPLLTSNDIDGELAALSVRVDQVSQPGYWDFASSDADRTMSDLSQILDAQETPEF